MPAQPGLVRVLGVVVVLLFGAGLGGLRVTPADDDGDSGQTAAPVEVEVTTSTTLVIVTTTVAPPVTAPPTTAPAPPVTPTSRPPLTPLPPSPTTAPPPPPPPAPTTTQPGPVARNDGSPQQRIPVPADAQAYPISVTANDEPRGRIVQISAAGRAGAQFGSDPAQGIVYYSPPAGFAGPDSFTYTFWNDRNQRASATVYVEVG